MEPSLKTNLIVQNFRIPARRWNRNFIRCNVVVWCHGIRVIITRANRLIEIWRHHVTIASHGRLMMMTATHTGHVAHHITHWRRTGGAAGRRTTAHTVGWGIAQRMVLTARFRSAWGATARTFFGNQIAWHFAFERIDVFLTKVVAQLMYLTKELLYIVYQYSTGNKFWISINKIWDFCIWKTFYIFSILWLF